LGRSLIKSTDEVSYTHTHTIISNCLVFGKVTTIVEDDQSKTANVTFTMTRKGTTPLGEYVGNVNGSTIVNTCKMKLSEKGWRTVDDNTKFKYVNPQTYFFFNVSGEYQEMTEGTD